MRAAVFGARPLDANPKKSSELPGSRTPADGTRAPRRRVRDPRPPRWAARLTYFFALWRARANASLLRRWIPRARCARRERERREFRGPAPPAHLPPGSHPRAKPSPLSEITRCPAELRKSRPDMTDLDDHSTLGDDFIEMRTDDRPKARHAASNRAMAVPPEPTPLRENYIRRSRLNARNARRTPRTPSFLPIFPCRRSKYSRLSVYRGISARTARTPLVTRANARDS